MCFHWVLKYIKKAMVCGYQAYTYVNQTVKSDCIPTQWLKAQKNHRNLALAFIFGFGKTIPNSLFVKLLSVTV